MGPVNKNRKRHNVLEYAGQRDKTAVTWRGKAERKKKQIIHKAIVKKKYARIKKHVEGDIPEFYSEIFAQVDAQREAEAKTRHNQTSSEDEPKTRENSDADESIKQTTSNVQSTDKDTPSEATTTTPSTKKRKRQPKPNPFRQAQLEAEEKRRELERIREQKRLEREQRLKEIEEKKKQRLIARNRMLKKTRTGQPSMASRIEHILDKLRK